MASVKSHGTVVNLKCGAPPGGLGKGGRGGGSMGRCS